ncbi:cation:proton antiporter [Kaistella jeonii]|uniref:Sodium:proton antiporter n=1 Tax=Kaistella jeonii TaxID=266749 RepID=A0A0C1CXT5_9FLAO|nr:cation:proton antiporter [Kaistella jeonii]KIA89161.1 sodium:proton antiporter [Kaistella jeonii]SFB94280.1 Sodium/hydrogen exchanger family protein [Kaistella jeonii]VEI97087.1 NhaP-type Na+/H+ and K+/H+ antiporters [Kaistella jeonii]
MAEMFIIGICVILLVSYIFDITSKFTKVPSVIFLLATGWLLNQVGGLFNIIIPNLNVVLPVLGTIGLILIVLEGSLELELNRSNQSVIKKSALIALLPLVIIAIGFSLFLYYEWEVPFKQSLINIIPFCIISSSIAIPSAINLTKDKRQFITYESSLSDIIGVVFFNFATFGTAITLSGAFHFVGQFMLMLVISLVASLVLAFLLAKIDHHIKYGPIIILNILIYEISKIYHLPALIFILFFGLILGNIDELKHLKFLRNVRFTKLNSEVKHFKDVVVEATFIVRTLFFIVFGFVLKTEDIINTDSLVWSVSIVIAIYLLRAIFLKLGKMDMQPLFYIAPRGLITVLLFLSITPEDRFPYLNESVVIQVILLTTFIMMIGLVFEKKVKPEMLRFPNFKKDRHPEE